MSHDVRQQSLSIPRQCRIRGPLKNQYASLVGSMGDELRIAIITWIERTYQRRRRQRALGRFTPIEYETLTTVAIAA